MSANYSPQTWIDNDPTGHPVSAARMTNIENGIAAVDGAAQSGISANATAISALQSQVGYQIASL